MSDLSKAVGDLTTVVDAVGFWKHRARAAEERAALAESRELTLITIILNAIEPHSPGCPDAATPPPGLCNCGVSAYLAARKEGP